MKFAAAIVATLVLASAISARAEDIVIGAPVSLTGTYGYVGTDAVKGMQLAIDDINATNKLGDGRKLKLMVEEEAAKLEARKLITREDQTVTDGQRGVVRCGEGQSAINIEVLHGTVYAVVASDAAQVPLNHLRDAVPMRGIDIFELRNCDFRKIAVHADLRGAENVLRDMI